MIESLTRMKDFDSLPKVVQSKTPLDFFSELEAKDAHNLCTWKGELYLELHRGTYTSQAKVGLELLIVLSGTNMLTAIPSWALYTVRDSFTIVWFCMAFREDLFLLQLQCLVLVCFHLLMYIPVEEDEQTAGISVPWCWVFAMCNGTPLWHYSRSHRGIFPLEEPMAKDAS